MYQARIDWGNIHGIGRTERMVLEVYDVASGARLRAIHLPFYFR